MCRYPESYDLYANHGVIDQAVLRIERIPDTVQTKKVDYGLSGLLDKPVRTIDSRFQ